MNRSLAPVALALAALLPCAAVAQDLVVTAGKHARVLLDNDRVRVIELKIPAGGSTGMHAHGDHIVYFLAGGSALQASPDGTSRERAIKAGEIQWSEPTTHDTRNTGKTPAHALIIELKPAK